jgi:hypothetical protein
MTRLTSFGSVLGAAQQACRGPFGEPGRAMRPDLSQRGLDLGQRPRRRPDTHFLPHSTGEAFGDLPSGHDRDVLSDQYEEQRAGLRQQAGSRPQRAPKASLYVETGKPLVRAWRSQARPTTSEALHSWLTPLVRLFRTDGTTRCR